MTEIIVPALEMTGQRGIINKDWGGLGSLKEPKDFVYLLDNCPHDWLFLQCVAVAIEKGRDLTPRELHLHVHTHGHDGKSFVDERARIVHERYEEILREKIESQYDIDQREAYYQAVGGEKKRRIYALGSQAKSYYGPNLSMTSFFDASSSVPLPVSQSAPIENLEEFVKRLIPTLTDHMIHILVERIHNGISSSH